MKKTIITLTIATACAVVSGFTPANANGGKKASPVLSKAAITIHQDFPQAQNIVWLTAGKNQIALFKEEGRKIKCVFNEKGRLESTFITSCDVMYLPFELHTSLSKKFRGYVPQTMTEYITPGRHEYYILLKNQQDKIINWIRVKSDVDGNTIQIIQELHQPV